MESLKRKVVVLDNGGETCDRYTIIFRETADIYGCSSNPFHPMGIGQYCANAAQVIKWNDTTERENRIAVNIYLKDCKSIGKRVKDLETLPEDVKKYIKQIYEQFGSYLKKYYLYIELVTNLKHKEYENFPTIR